jgi:hypothetical protein
MRDGLYDEYNAAIGAVMGARKAYNDLCAAQGPASGAAEEAQQDLQRVISQRDEVRERYDAASRAQGPTRP